MNSFSFSSTNELKKFLTDNRFSKILIICGEKSGDNHGSFLVKELLKKKTIFKDPLLGWKYDEACRC